MNSSPTSSAHITSAVGLTPRGVAVVSAEEGGRGESGGMSAGEETEGV